MKNSKTINSASVLRRRLARDNTAPNGDRMASFVSRCANTVDISRQSQASPVSVTEEEQRDDKTICRNGSESSDPLPRDALHLDT